VAGDTRFGRTLERTPLMAFHTGHLEMFALQ
jgi:hypothetical protein